jgi:hypothetical protein
MFRIKPNARFDAQRNAIKPENHPELHEPGAGLAKVTQYDRTMQDLKSKLIDAKAALDKHKLKAPAAPQKNGKK